MDPRDPRDERLAHDPRDPRDERREQRAAIEVENDRNRHGALWLTVLVVVLFGISIFWSSHTATVAANGRAQIEQTAIDAQKKAIEAQNKAISAACDFWYPLTSLPVTTNITTGKPTELSVRIIAGARESYNGQCVNIPGRPPLPPADPSVTRWAKIYGIALPDPP